MRHPSHMELFVHGEKEETGGQRVTAKQDQLLKKLKGKTKHGDLWRKHCVRSL